MRNEPFACDPFALSFRKLGKLEEEEDRKE